MAHEISSLKNAKDRLQALFGDCNNMLDEYAEIAWFLSQGKEFISAFLKLDKVIWEEYYNKLEPGAHNRFSRALLNYAKDKHGFSAQANIVLVANVPTSDFAKYVEGAALWKDSLSSGHGEFSHTLQWLAAGVYKESLGAKLKELYVNSIRITSGKKKANKAADGTYSDMVYLWEWLVDCFPQDRDTAKDKSVEGIFSNSLRSPSATTKYIMTAPQGKCFMSDLLRNRYKARGWFDTVNNAPKPLAIADYGLDRHKDDATWKKKSHMEGGNKFVAHAYERSTDESAKAVNTNKKTLTCIYHGVEGVISGSSTGL
ncbi:MAG: hypothetical protein JNK95_06570 [Candidatus Competibacter sp.]|nr:hypothetical protein [Candidatus Competibacter sp.]MDG4606828.1 hypothetical protein [Candidatus Contendobacter sp.]HRD48417.1 hypothetical protein [Candidatus Contendobacter sp.]